MGSLFSGISTIPKSWRFLRKHPKILPLIAVPLCIGALVGALAVVGAFWIAGPNSLGTLPDFAWTFNSLWNLLNFGFSFLWKLVQWVFLTIVFYLLGFTLLCSFFFSLMVEKLEGVLGLEPDESKSPPLITQIADGLRLLFFLLAGQILILLFHLIPLIGTLSAPLFGFLFQAFCLGMECFDFTLSLRGMVFKRKLEFCKEHLGWTLGTGGVTSLFMLIPILNSSFLTLSIIGATLLHRRERIQKIFLSQFKNQADELQCLSDGDQVLVRYVPEEMKSLGEPEKDFPNPGELLYVAENSSKEILIFTAGGCRLKVKNDTEEFLKTLRAPMN